MMKNGLAFAGFERETGQNRTFLMRGHLADYMYR